MRTQLARGGLTAMERALPLLRCPTHAHDEDGEHARLVADRDGLACLPGDGAVQNGSQERVVHRFPSVSGIPCLFEDPHTELAQWRYQLEDFLGDNDATGDTVLAMLAGASPHPRSRDRLQRLHQALADHGRRVAALMATAGVEPSKRQERDRRVRTPGEGTLTAYYHQIHRDWGWADQDTDENRAALEAVLGVMDRARPPRRILAIGAGACRLPYDLHVALRPELTLALDLNPLPFIVAREVIAGRSLRLWEFPVSPRSSEQVAVDRELRCHNPNVPGFELLFADGLHPPVADGSFDAVLTPWFIDQVPKDMVEWFDQVHRVLAPGGVWINHGPLIYHPSHTMLAHRYPVDEVLALVADAGFEVETHCFDRSLYMQSPVGSQGRTETVLTFRARKLDTKATTRAPERPTWLDDPDQPVPQLRAQGYQPPHPMFAAVLRLINGQRTTRDIANELVQKHNLPPQAAVGGVQACLAEIWRAIAGQE